MIDPFSPQRLARFLEKVLSIPPPSGFRGHGDCLLWQGALDADGYGRFWCPGFPGISGRPRPRTVFAHRWSVVFVFGPAVLHKLTADHRCRRHACASPLHSFPISHRENVARGNRMRSLDWEAVDLFEELGI